MMNTFLSAYLKAAGVENPTPQQLTRATNDCQEFTRLGAQHPHKCGGEDVVKCAEIFFRGRNGLLEKEKDKKHPAALIAEKFSPDLLQ